MSVLTAPHVAMRLLGDVAYPMRSLVDGNPLAAFEPRLPEGFRWALPDEVALADIIPLDVTNLAEVLFCSPLDPAHASDDDILAAMHRELVAVYCDIAKCAGELGQRYGDHPAETASRMSWCITCAARLLDVEV